MGEVYLADDAKLGRQVALKVLADSSAADTERRARFAREARAVAALNHPNIITIYSVEDVDGLLFMTMELVEGRPLGDLIPRDGMAFEPLLKLAIPLADAVAAAHQRGITHRDLKPANVMVSDDGRVKVLDFGVAKVDEETSGDGLAAAVTREQLTAEGHIVGTVAYMSPEQAQGKSVDARSDVFSLGIVLFEMATGGKPFNGETNVSVLSSILKDTPPSVADLRQDLPIELGRIVQRCLAKDPGERYQTAWDVRDDLRRLEDIEPAAVTRATASTQEPLSIQAPASGRRRLVLTGAAAALVGMALVAGWRYFGRSEGTTTEAFSKIKPMRRLTNTGTTRSAAISPDGRYVVHDEGTFGRPGLSIRQVSTTSSVQIVPPAVGAYAGLAFSPDGEAVLYTFGPGYSDSPSLFRVPLLGGTPRKLLDDIATPPAFSPDGARMAFVRGAPGRERVIVLASADGGNQRPLATRPDSDPYSLTRLAWSPNGRLVAAFAGAMPMQKSRVVLVDVNTGNEQPLSDARFDAGGQLVWLADGSELIFDATERYGGRWNFNSQLWSVAYPSGAVRRITADGASYSSVAATRDGRTLVAVRDEIRASLWVAPRGDTARARPILASSGGREGATGIDWLPDGRILYGAITQDSWDIWIANGDGSQPRQLTSDPGVENQPRVLPDGSGLIFTSRATGGSEVQVRAIDFDGATANVIDTGGAIYRGYVQPCGAHIYFNVLIQGSVVAYRVPIGGGPREALFADSSRLPARFVMSSVSPDERWAAGSYDEPSGSGLAVVPIHTAGPMRRFPRRYTPGFGFGITWAPDGLALEDLVMRDGATNVWRIPIDGSAPRPVTTFTSEHILNYRWSPDGKTLAMSRGTWSLDVVLITSDDKEE